MASQSMPLDVLKGITVAILDLAETLGRPLLVRERRAFAWVLSGWRASILKGKFKAMPQEEADYYFKLLDQFSNLVHPDPVRKVRLKRTKPALVAERNDGNFSVKSPLFNGVSVRRMTAKEAAERVALLAKLTDGIVVIVRELALLRNRNYPQAARITQRAQMVAKLSGNFVKLVEKSPEIPAEQSIDEVMDGMRTMNELMTGTDA